MSAIAMKLYQLLKCLSFEGVAGSTDLFIGIQSFKSLVLLNGRVCVCNAKKG